MKKFVTSLVCLVFVWAVFGCQMVNLSQKKTPVDAGDVRYPLTLTDQAGNQVTIPKLPERIVSLIPSNTEILFAIGAGSKVVGVTNNDNYPEEVKKLPKVGDITIDAEKVVALKPDVVFASPLNGNETIDKLKQLGLTVFLLDASSLKGVYRSIDLAGQVTNMLRQSDQLIGDMEAKKLSIFRQVTQAKQNTPTVKVWVESDPSLFTAGNGTLVHELVTIAGGDNVAKKQSGWPQISSEQVVKWNPDIIISMYGDTSVIEKRAGWQTIHAIQQKRVTTINPDIISRPGPRVVDAIQELAKAFYPGQIK
jgi:iron complex transport system substrate-binding protein